MKPLKSNLSQLAGFLWLSLFSIVSSVFAQDSLYIKEHYNKYEHLIPMRDGVRLFTSVYVPKDTTQLYPILLTRTPYSVSPYGADRYPNNVGNQRSRYFREGYIIAYEDVRGRYRSEGEFVNVRPFIPVKKSNKDIDESTDAYDTIDWLVKNVPRNNGRVGISGISYPGFYSSMSAIDAHPSVKAVSPQAPVSQWMSGDDFFHNGAFLLPHAFGFYTWFGKPRPKPKSEPDIPFNYGTPDGYKFFLEMGPLINSNTKYLKDSVAFWKELTQHGTWDSFWQERSVLPHLKNIRPAMMFVGGWFDTENLYGALHAYAAAEKNNPGATNLLVMGPWSHGQWGANDGEALGDIHFGSKTSIFYTDSIEAPFFNHYLKGKGEVKRFEAAAFQTGLNEWRFLDSWPPKNTEAREIYLDENGKLSFDAPKNVKTEYDQYTSDPMKPVPYTAEISHWYNPAFMVEDQRFASRRPDVLVYQTDVLQDNLTVAGPITAGLFVSTSATDCDWVVKVIDVFPDDAPDPALNPRNVKLGGYEMLVRGDVLRGKFRNSLSKPEPFIPSGVTKVEFELQDVFHTFKKGHRIMVQVQSTWFPMIDRNPGKFVDIYNATESDFLKTTQRVYRSAKFQSHLKVNIIK
ncbi:MAG: CocE/NonD family hydrolase [Bacteroidota bacterium]